MQPRVDEPSGDPVRTYRERRRTAALATLAFALPALLFGAEAVAVFVRGGDKRIGILPYFGFVVTVVVGWFVLRPLWRLVGKARWELANPVEDLPPGDHLSLTNQVPPPLRW
jgi:hypothetical protein